MNSYLNDFGHVNGNLEGEFSRRRGYVEPGIPTQGAEFLGAQLPGRVLGAPRSQPAEFLESHGMKFGEAHLFRQAKGAAGAQLVEIPAAQFSRGGKRFKGLFRTEAAARYESCKVLLRFETGSFGETAWIKSLSRPVP